jgi:hypothetical protein
MDGEPLKLGVVEFPVSDDEADGGVVVSVARLPVGIPAGRRIEHEFGDLGRPAPAWRRMARNDVAFSIDD